ncbi:polyubiquitin-like [Pyrus ussuriensis x Pyrus communis]|uniref:Polyubiquitin-like n=1 Tax=Pyrus ussuriensis x Pyrus communis TaxID=2448454 RepID=A0A5N5FD44_9ROSA|nr:polyubiquitin-like [Pyrus ussuriensis x Pyrus communis]
MDVIFELQRGRSFTIEVGYFDTVLEIKEKVQKYQGIPISHQTLIFNGRVLDDERNVEYCDIYNNSRVQLLIASEFDKPANNSNCNNNVKAMEEYCPKKIQLKVKTPTSKMHVPIEMDVNDTVSKLKEKIQAMDQSIPLNRLVLHAVGNELHDHRSLHECELSDNAEIEVSLRPSAPATSPVSMGGAGVGGGCGMGSKNKLKLMVLTKCGTKKIAVDVNPLDNVGELRKELQRLHQSQMNFHLPQESYFFIYKQNVMEDDRSFRWHQVAQGDTIEIFNGSVTGGS